jgi:hypothetical protein
MSTANLDSADLKAVTKGGLIREDVMNRIWDISKIPLPFTDMIGSEMTKNSLKEWTTDVLATPDIANARVDGADASGNNTRTGARVGNHCQISDKVVRVSFRADASNVIGRAKELAYQLSRRQQELRRDVEAIFLNNQASVADDGNATPGKVGGLPSWIKTNSPSGYGFGAGGVVGGFNSATGLTVARTPSTAKRAITETFIRNAAQDVYTQGGDPTVLMTTPDVVRKISEYLFTSSARIATLTSEISNKREAAVATGSVNVFVTDFGVVLKLVPNRIQQPHADGTSVTAGSFVIGTKYIITAAGTTDFTLIGASSSTVGVIFTATGVGAGTGTARAVCSDVFIIDPAYLAACYLKGYRTEELAKTGLAENRQMSVDYTLIVNTELSHALIGDIDGSASMTA